jgi:diguanylate cyclase (GGDEF)-like protein
MQVLRTSDAKCRYGGDEFILVLPDTPLDAAEHVARGIGKAIAAQPIEYNGETLSVTLSVGIACAGAGEVDAKAVIHRADQALYCAKKSGRSRSCSASMDENKVESDAEAAMAAVSYLLPHGSAA